MIPASTIVCVQCGKPAESIYKEYSAGNIRLSRCVSAILFLSSPHRVSGQQYCGNIVDKYIEYETLLIFIDMVLHRLEVYRHVLFNRSWSHDRSYYVR